jgi:hypothetical protein
MGDARSNERIVALKALCVLLYALGKASGGMTAKLLGRHRSLIHRWIGEAGLTDEAVIGGETTQIEFADMRRFMQSKKRKFNSSSPLTVAAGELSPGLSVVVIAQSASVSAPR